MITMNQNLSSEKSSMHESHSPARLHPAWVAFIQHCQRLEFGEISQLKIQNGVPVMAEETIKKVKFV